MEVRVIRITNQEGNHQISKTSRTLRNVKLDILGRGRLLANDLIVSIRFENDLIREGKEIKRYVVIRGVLEIRGEIEKEPNI